MKEKEKEKEKENEGDRVTRNGTILVSTIIREKRRRKREERG